MARVYQGERTWLDPVLVPVERAIYRVSGVDWQQEQGWRGYTAAMLLFNLFGLLLTYVILRAQGILPLNPQDLVGDHPGPGVQHRRLVHHQHQLAELRRRDDDELLQPDGRAGRPQLHLGRRRHGDRHRAGPRHLAAERQHDRQLLGRPGALACSTSCCRSASSSPSSWSRWACRRRSAPTSRRPRSRAPPRRSRIGPVASQEIIKELGTNGGGFFNANSAHPFENPTPLTNLITNFAIIVDPGRDLLHLRADGRRHPPGLGALGRDRSSSSSSAWPWPCRSSSAATR